MQSATSVQSGQSKLVSLPLAGIRGLAFYHHGKVSVYNCSHMVVTGKPTACYLSSQSFHKSSDAARATHHHDHSECRNPQPIEILILYLQGASGHEIWKGLQRAWIILLWHADRITDLSGVASSVLTKLISGCGFCRRLRLCSSTQAGPRRSLMMWAGHKAVGNLGRRQLTHSLGLRAAHRYVLSCYS